jgi:molybdopterin synthase catalytic subunit
MVRVRVSVQLFAGLRQRAGTSRVEVELAQGATVSDLLAALASTPVGPLAPRSCIVAVNREYAEASEPIGPDDELALIPPVSGGASPVRHVRVTGEPLDLAALSGAVRDPRAGAVVLFEGITREVEALEYEAYAEMAEASIARIAAEEAERHDLLAVAVEHRTGRVALGEPSVIVAASSGHRGEAFAGARAVIDRVKAESPIWKREEGVWIEGELPSPRAREAHQTES